MHTPNMSQAILALRGVGRETSIGDILDISLRDFNVVDGKLQLYVGDPKAEKILRRELDSYVSKHTVLPIMKAYIHRRITEIKVLPLYPQTLPERQATEVLERLRF